MHESSLNSSLQSLRPPLISADDALLRAATVSGWIPEWPNGADCKSAVFDFEGSNPSPPTIVILRGLRGFYSWQESGSVSHLRIFCAFSRFGRASASEIVGIMPRRRSGQAAALYRIDRDQKAKLLPLRAQAVAAVVGIQFANGMFPDLRAVQ